MHLFAPSTFLAFACFPRWMNNGCVRRALDSLDGASEDKRNVLRQALEPLQIRGEGVPAPPVLVKGDFLGIFRFPTSREPHTALE